MSFKIRKTNDADRPEWSIFAGLTGVTHFRPGMSECEAAAGMKAAAAAAWAANPIRFLSAVGGPSFSDRARAMAPSERAEFVEFCHYSFVLDHAKGEVNFEKAATHKDSRLPLDFWKPELGGFVPYARMRLLGFYEAWAKQRAEKGNVVSVDKVHASGLELAANGTFVRDFEADEGREDVEVCEHAKGLTQNERRRRERLTEFAGKLRAQVAEHATKEAGSLFHAVSGNAIRLVDLINCSATDELLDSTERLDHLFLAQEFGVVAEEDLAPEELHATVKNRALEWAGSLSLPTVHRNGILRTLREWNPATDGYFSEAIADSLRRIAEGAPKDAERELQRWGRPSRHAAPNGRASRDNGARCEYGQAAFDLVTA